MAVIRLIKGGQYDARYPLDSPVAVMGRHPDCDIVLDVAAVSRQHAQILRDDESYFLEDLSSRNGTYVNGKLIQGRQRLQEGDRFRICDLDFAFFFNDPSDSLAGPRNDQSSLALLFDEEAEGTTSHSTVMSTFDVVSSHQGASLAARPESKLRAMVEIAQNLGRALSLEAVLPKLLDSLFKIFLQADRGFVILAEEEEPLVLKAVKHRRAGDSEAIRISRTIVRQAMNSKEAILSADAASDERFDMSQSIADFHIRSLMCAPLINSEGKALGVIQIDALDRGNRFTRDDLEVLASVAAQAAIVIDNAQLHEQALRQREVQRDLDLARRVQQGLLPARAPTLPGYHFFNFYEAANQVGGDYYDYVPLAGGRVAVVVGDVSGKGVSAALLMAKLAGDVRFCLASAADPAEAVSRINATFAGSQWEDRFVTFVVAVVDPGRHELTVINAGHMPPLLRNRAGQVEEIGAGQAGLPLGVDAEFQYQSYVRPLEPGDSITIFTDGISEALNAEGEFYGLPRLRQAVGSAAAGASELGHHILDDVSHFVDGHPQSDDMCLACFGRLEAESSDQKGK